MSGHRLRNQRAQAASFCIVHYQEFRSKNNATIETPSRSPGASEPEIIPTFYARTPQRNVRIVLGDKKVPLGTSIAR